MVPGYWAVKVITTCVPSITGTTVNTFEEYVPVTEAELPGPIADALVVLEPTVAVGVIVEPKIEPIGLAGETTAVDVEEGIGPIPTFTET